VEEEEAEDEDAEIDGSDEEDEEEDPDGDDCAGGEAGDTADVGAAPTGTDECLGGSTGGTGSGMNCGKSGGKSDGKGTTNLSALERKSSTEKQAALGKCKSTTHKREWDKFTRMKLPIALKEKFEKDKHGLFNVFLLCGEDVTECVQHYERISENQKKHQDEWELVAKRELGKHYKDDQIAIIIERRKAQGWYEKDEEFPDDEDMVKYWVRVKKSLTLAQIKSERLTLEMTNQVTKENAAALVDSDAYAQTLNYMDDKGSKLFWDKMLQPAAPGPKMPKKEKTDPVVPFTPLDVAQDSMSKMLKVVGHVYTPVSVSPLGPASNFNNLSLVCALVEQCFRGLVL
jgi:hypothetical protein